MMGQVCFEEDWEGDSDDDFKVKRESEESNEGVQPLPGIDMYRCEH